MRQKFTHDKFVKMLGELHPNIEVIGTYKNMDTRIRVRCKNDGYEWDPKAKQLFQLKMGCPVCSGRKIMPGVNDLNTLRPDLIKYLKNKEDGENLRPASNKRIKVICPDCGYEKEMFVYSLVDGGFSCPQCSDGISYPNKFVRCILRQLNIDYVPEKIFSWDKRKRYDQYLEKYNMIIENHGIQHYQSNTLMVSVEKQKLIDLEKMEAAKKNGIKNYIVLNCMYSELEWIKNSIMTSDLPQIFNFNENDIDWNLCEYTASKSLLPQTVNYLNDGYSRIEIAEKLDVSPTTINDYVRRAVEIGMYQLPEKQPVKPSMKQEEYFAILRDNSNKKLEKFMEYKKENPGVDYLDICTAIGIERSTIAGILKKAFDDGVIDYDVRQEIAEHKIKILNNLKRTDKTVYVYDYLSKNYIKSYTSVAEASRDINCDPNRIYAVCHGSRKQFNGLYFSYNKL